MRLCIHAQENIYAFSLLHKWEDDACSCVFLSGLRPHIEVVTLHCGVCHQASPESMDTPFLVFHYHYKWCWNKEPSSPSFCASKYVGEVPRGGAARRKLSVPVTYCRVTLGRGGRGRRPVLGSSGGALGLFRPWLGRSLRGGVCGPVSFQGQEQPADRSP